MHYHPVDNEGYLLNIGSRELIQEEFQPLIADTVESIAAVSTPNLIAVRGSISCGQAIPLISDADIVVFDAGLSDSQLRNITEELNAHHQIVSEVDITDITTEELLTNPKWTRLQFNLATRSASVFGEALPRFHRFKPDRSLTLTLYPDLAAEFESLALTMEAEGAIPQYGYKPRDHRFWCVWSMRTYLRGWACIVAANTGAYECDLLKCADNITEHFPSLTADVATACEWAIRPTNDRNEVAFFLRNSAALVRKIAPEFTSATLDDTTSPPKNGLHT